jgi:hypothetical protein
MVVMNNEDLDKLFREKINASSNGNNQNADWDVFSKLLSKSEGFENIDFDKDIVSKVANHKAKFDNKHWELLKQRLIKEERLRKKVFITTLLESVAVICLLFMFQKYDSSITQDLNNFADQYSNGTSQSSKEGKGSTKIQKVSLDDISTIYSHQAYAFQENENLENDQSNTDQVNEASADNNEFVENKEIKTLDPLQLNREIAQLNISNLVQKVENLFSQEPVKQISISIPIEEKTGSEKQVEEVAITAVERNTFITPLLESKKQEIAMALSNNPEVLNVSLPSSIKYKETESMHFIQPTLGFGQSIIKSSYDKIYNLKAYTTYATQVNLGVMYAFKKNNLELQSGLRYMNKEYNPQKISELYYDISNNPYRVSLEKIEYDIVEVPLHFKCYFKQSPKINFYAKMGASLNFTLLSHYVVDENLYTNYSRSARITTSDGEILNDNSRLSRKEFTPGLLQNGGSFSNNTFVTVAGEIGLERRINKNTFFVMNTEYAKYFIVEGIGPNEDKFNMLNLNIGLKYRLK